MINSTAKSHITRFSRGNAQVIDPKNINADGRCVFGATVKLEDVNNGDVVHMTVTLSKKPTSAWVPYAIDSKGNVRRTSRRG